VHTSPEEALQGFLDLKSDVMIPMHYGTFRLGREPMEEPLPRLLGAAERAGLGERVVALGEGESWKKTASGDSIVCIAASRGGSRNDTSGAKAQAVLGGIGGTTEVVP
jgi:hypothetical protein